MKRSTFLLLMQGSSGAAAPVVTPTMYDDFLDARAAGAVNGTLATDGVSARTVVDTTNKLSISVANGLELASAAAGNGNPGIWYPQQTRVFGLAVAWQIVVNSGSPLTVFGFDDDQSGVSRDGIYFVSGNILRIFFNGNQREILSGIFANGVTYYGVTILRNPGALTWVKGGAFTEWSFGFPAIVNTYNPYPTASSVTGSAGSLYARKTKTAVLASYNSQYATVTVRKAISVNGDTITAAAGDAVIEHTITTVLGLTQELMVRRTDDNNCVIIRMDQTAGTIKVYEKIAGVETELPGGTTTITWTPGFAFRVVVSLYGNFIFVTVGNSGKNNAVSTGFNATVTGVKVSHAGTDLIAWPINPTGAALAELNAFFP